MCCLLPRMNENCTVSPLPPPPPSPRVSGRDRDRMTRIDTPYRRRKAGRSAAETGRGHPSAYGTAETPLPAVDVCSFLR